MLTISLLCFLALIEASGSCELDCSGNGVLDELSCECDCDPLWTRDNCDYPACQDDLDYPSANMPFTCAQLVQMNGGGCDLDWMFVECPIACGVCMCKAETDCSGHGTTTDELNIDGCDCVCDYGWHGPDCSQYGITTPENPVFSSAVTTTLQCILETPELSQTFATTFEYLVNGNLYSETELQALDQFDSVSFGTGSSRLTAFIQIKDFTISDWGMTVSCCGEVAQTSERFCTSETTIMVSDYMEPIRPPHKANLLKDITFECGISLNATLGKAFIPTIYWTVNQFMLDTSTWNQLSAANSGRPGGILVNRISAEELRTSDLVLEGTMTLANLSVFDNQTSWGCCGFSGAQNDDMFCEEYTIVFDTPDEMFPVPNAICTACNDFECTEAECLPGFVDWNEDLVDGCEGTPNPTTAPTVKPSVSLPTWVPSISIPTTSPSIFPTSTIPSTAPSSLPTSTQPSYHPTTSSPSHSPSFSPSSTLPSSHPSSTLPTTTPSVSPSSNLPSSQPSFTSPSIHPSSSPTSTLPSFSPSSIFPSTNPSLQPSTNIPSSNPISSLPSKIPSSSPSFTNPSTSPSSCPTSSIPSPSPTTVTPTENPSIPPTNTEPSTSPSIPAPSLSPSFVPTSTITTTPSFSFPSTTPSILPSFTFPSQRPSFSISSKQPSTSIPSTTPLTSLPSTKPDYSPSLSPVSSNFPQLLGFTSLFFLSHAKVGDVRGHFDNLPSIVLISSFCFHFAFFKVESIVRSL